MAGGDVRKTIPRTTAETYALDTAFHQLYCDHHSSNAGHPSCCLSEPWEWSNLAHLMSASDVLFSQVYTSSKPLRIGYYEGDGYFQPSPSMKRAVQQTRRLLQDAGHTVGFHACGCLELLSCSLQSLDKSLPMSAFAAHKTGTVFPCCKDPEEEGTCNSLFPKQKQSCS